MGEGNRRKSLLIQSPMEDEKILRSRQCTQEGVRAAGAIACVATAVPTVIRTIPWAKANLNYTGQALIISAVQVLGLIIILFLGPAASLAAYFITVDKTILECARRNALYKPS